MKLLSLVLRNFMSFGARDTGIDLNRKTMALIVGDNRDVGDTGSSRNGAGKTTMMQGILFALYGKGIDAEMSADNFINEINEKKLHVELVFEKNGRTYKITRRRKPTDLKFVEIDETGETIDTLTRDSMSNTDKSIIDVCGMNYELFTATYFMSPHKKSFLAMTPAKQRDFMENVLSLDVINNRADTLKKMKSELVTDLKIAKRDLESEIASRDNNQALITSAQQRYDQFEVDTKKKIADLEEQLSLLNQVDFEAQRELYVQQTELTRDKKSQDEVVQSLRSEYAGYNETINTAQRKINEIESAKVKADSYMNGLNIQRDDIIAKLDPYKDTDTEAVEAAIKECEMMINHAQSEHNSIKESLKDTQSDVTIYRREVVECSKKIEKIDSELVDLESGSCPYCKQAHTDDVKIEQLRKEKRDLEAKISQRESNVSELEELISQATEFLDTRQAFGELEEKYDGKPEAFLDCSRNTIREITRLLGELDTVEAKIGNGDIAKDQYDALVDKHGDISELQNTITTAKKNQEECQRAAEKAKAKSEELTKSLEDLKNQLVASDEAELAEYAASISTNEKALAELKGSTNPHGESIEELKAVVFSVDEISKNVDELEKKINHIDFLVRLLTDPKSYVRQNIVSQYIPFLNKKINEYSEFLGLPHTVEVNSDMTTTIHNQRPTTYFNMSQGERLRANIATTIAFGDLLKVLGKDCNLIMFDELLDSAIDSFGGVQIMKFIKQKFGNFWMISHREDFVDYVDEVVEVVKQDGFSSINYK